MYFLEAQSTITWNPVVQAMLDDLCEVAKREMKEKNDGDLGSWKRAVTTADGTWHTRGWHSKNATFTITFQRAKEGMDVAIHWQDADSSSAKAIYPKAEIMLCGAFIHYFVVPIG